MLLVGPDYCHHCGHITYPTNYASESAHSGSLDVKDAAFKSQARVQNDRKLQIGAGRAESDIGRYNRAVIASR